MELIMAMSTSLDHPLHPINRISITNKINIILLIKKDIIIHSQKYYDFFFLALVTLLTSLSFSLSF